jgi:serine/threonine-protein kinase
VAATLSRASSRESDATTAAVRGPDVLDTIAQRIGVVPRVLLRDTNAEVPEPVIRPDARDAVAVDRYRIDGEIARGGMGTVLKGRDPALGRDVALKVLRDDRRDDADLVRRFVEEAQIGGQLQHPGVVPIYELGTLNDCRPFFAMKLVKGQTLASLLRARCEPADGLPRFLSMYEAICQTVAYAHARGVIHRDLKPSNVMVGSFGEVQVMDWGLAKVLARGGVSDDAEAGKEPSAETLIATSRTGADTDHSQAGSILGTPSYMAPEQARGDIDAIDERCDVFALGSILCEILTGQPVFIGRTSDEIRRKAAIADTADALTRLDSGAVAPELVALARDCLARERTDRPRDASTVASRVTAYLSGVQEQLRTAERERAAAEARAAEQKKRRRVQAALGLTFTGFVLLGGAFAWWAADQRRSRRMEAERAVGRALETAVSRLGQARGDDRNPALLAEARAAALQAREQSSRAPAEVRARVEATLAEIDRVEKTRRLVAALREVHAGSGDSSVTATDAALVVNKAHETADARYRQAFREYGFDPDELEPDPAAERLRQLGGESTVDLAAALDDWAYIRSRRDLSTAERAPAPRADADAGTPGERLFAVSRRLDPDPVRNRVRDAASRLDGRALSALADEIDPAAHPSQTIILVGMGLAATRRQDKAVRFWQAARLHHPDDFRINEGLARYHNEQAQFGEALPYAMTAVALRRRSASAMDGLAACLVGLGRHEEAAAALGRLVRESPREWGRLLVFGGQIEDAGARTTAVPLYRTAADLALTNPVETFLTSSVPPLSSRQRPGLSESVLPALREGLASRPTASARFTLATFLGSAGQNDEAIAAYREALRLKPGDGDEYATLGSCLSLLQRYDEATAAYREALRLRPGHVTALAGLAAALDRGGKPEEALATYREAIRLHPGHVASRVEFGALLARRGDHDGALAEYREAARLTPESPLALLNLSNYLGNRGMFDETTAVWREAIRREPDIGYNHWGLGLALARHGKLDDAIAEYREAHRLKFDEVKVYSSIASARDVQGKYTEAIAAYREALRLKPPTADSLRVNLGSLLMRLRKWPEADAEFRELTRMYPDNYYGYVLVSQALTGQGKVDEAIAALRRAYELKPPAPIFASQLGNQIRRAEQLREFLSRLPGILMGEDRPKDNTQRLAWAWNCYQLSQFSSAARLWAEALAADPAAGDDLKAGHRYNEACAAALAGCGQGNDAPADEAARAALRRQALGLLRADLAQRAKRLDADGPGRTEALLNLEHSTRDFDVAGIRDPDALAKLPVAERAEWQAFWQEVGALIVKFRSRTP